MVLKTTTDHPLHPLLDQAKITPTATVSQSANGWMEVYRRRMEEEMGRMDGLTDGMGCGEQGMEREASRPR